MARLGRPVRSSWSARCCSSSSRRVVRSDDASRSARAAPTDRSEASKQARSPVAPSARTPTVAERAETGTSIVREDPGAPSICATPRRAVVATDSAISARATFVVPVTAPGSRSARATSPGTGDRPRAGERQKQTSTSRRSRVRRVTSAMASSGVTAAWLSSEPSADMAVSVARFRAASPVVITWTPSVGGPARGVRTACGRSSCSAVGAEESIPAGPPLGRGCA